MINVGDKAPEVLGINEKGEEIRLSAYKGKKIVLYFYPKDSTSAVSYTHLQYNIKYIHLPVDIQQTNNLHSSLKVNKYENNCPCLLYTSCLFPEFERQLPVEYRFQYLFQPE